GTTSFSKRRFAIFGSHKLSQVQLLVDLHANYRQDACASLPPARPPIIVTSDSLQVISLAIAGCLETSLAQDVSPTPLVDGPEGGNGGMNVLKAKIGDVKGRIVFQVLFSPSSYTFFGSESLPTSISLA
ncbi:hypothetical protein M404DRAFT_36433, partial [Pisolithus tinctorius Marx 270]